MDYAVGLLKNLEKKKHLFILLFILYIYKLEIQIRNTKVGGWGWCGVVWLVFF
jgi:hypothetical protein